MDDMKLRICHLYPDLLNLYGDSGNVMCLEHRCAVRNIETYTERVCVGDDFNHNDYDIIFIGGGQDFEQGILLDDLFKGKDVELQRAVEDGTSILAVCGGYQLLGRYYKTYDGKMLEYSGALDFYTLGNIKRFIGNMAFDTDFGTVYGFENHSGRTYLGDCKPLGKILSGKGNNGSDKTEGAKYKNTFCTYSHGPVLPKNPAFADLILTNALKRKYASFDLLSSIDDALENNARNQVDTLYFKNK